MKANCFITTTTCLIALVAVNSVAASALSYRVTLLNLPDLINTQAIGASGAIQVGSGLGGMTGGDHHALLWSGTASSVTDLNPAGFEESLASGVSGASQVGWGLGPA